MKILRLIYEWPPPWIGLVPQPYEITKSQARQGHEVTVFCARWPFAGPLELISGVIIKTFYREPVKGLWAFTTSALMGAYYLYYRRSYKPDIIHAHGHFALWIFLYRDVLKKFKPNAAELKIPVVAHFHNTAKGRWEKAIEDKKPLNFITKKISWPLEIYSNRLAIKISSAYIFVSEDVKNEAIKYYKAAPEKCFVVESGVNTDMFTPVHPDERDKTRDELGLIPTDKVIINYGYLVDRKNIHTLIESLIHLPVNYKLILMGTGDAAYLEKLNEIMEANNLKDRVIRIGYTPYPEIPIALQASDVFVLASAYEGMPKVIFESLACGVPVIASGFRASEELTGLYYLDNLDAQSIANKIKEIAENQTFVDINKVRALYSWNRKSEQIAAIYETLK